MTDFLMNDNAVLYSGKIKRFLGSTLTELRIEDVTPFQRKLIFHNIKPKYSKKLYFETIVVKDEREDQTDGNESSSSTGDTTDSKDIIDRIASSQISNGESNGSGSETKAKTQASRGDTKCRILRVVKLNQSEQLARNDEKKQQEMDMIGKGVGFAKVIRKISESVRIFDGGGVVSDGIIVSIKVNMFGLNRARLWWDTTCFSTLRTQCINLLKNYLIT